VFRGEIYDVYQWPQKMYDGSIATFEMLKRANTVVVIAIKDGMFVVLSQHQPNLKNEFLDFPGGRADAGELPIVSAKRELLEETGMAFKNWKLVDVRQPALKIEHFVYTFLATDFDSQVGTKHDNGEKIKQSLMTFEEVISKSEGQHRLDLNTDLFKKYGSLKGLVNAPEFTGREIETS